MDGMVATNGQVLGVETVIRRLHGLVIRGPWDLEIAAAMSVFGYDEVKWVEGQTMLAELVNCEAPAPSLLEAALAWYEEAATAARRALSAQPHLLARLGLKFAA